MKDNNHEHQMREGRLPAIAPLANPYVPFQLDNPPQYEAAKGIVRGTLYPGLDLPLMGEENTRPLPDTPLANLQMLGFAIQELALYLDTHRSDKEALEQYRAYQQMYRRLAEAQGRPLTHMSPGSGESYNWLDDPWPWEFCANKEG